MKRNRGRENRGREGEREAIQEGRKGMKSSNKRHGKIESERESKKVRWIESKGGSDGE